MTQNLTIDCELCSQQVDLVIDLQTELDFARVVALLPHPSEAEGQSVATQDRAVLVAALIEAKNSAVEDIQEVCPELDINPVVNVRALEDGDIFIGVEETSNITVRAWGVTE